MKTLKIEIKGIDGSEAMRFLTAITDIQGWCANPDTLDISYTWEEETPNTIAPTESTLFSRYLAATTPEGGTK